MAQPRCNGVFILIDSVGFTVVKSFQVFSPGWSTIILSAFFCKAHSGKRRTTQAAGTFLPNTISSSPACLYKCPLRPAIFPRAAWPVPARVRDSMARQGQARRHPANQMNNWF